MLLLKNTKVAFSLFGTLLMLSACSTASFPEIEENEAVASDSKVLKEGEALVGDQNNIAYDDDPDNSSKEYVVPAKTTPVIVADSAEIDDEDGFLTDEDDDSDLFASPLDREKKSAPAKTTENKPAPAKTAAKPAEPKFSDNFVPSVTYQVETFYFANGGSQLEGNYRARMREIVKEAKRNNGIIRVMGFASSRTRNTDLVTHKMANFKVSLARAEAVAAALKRAGMPSNRIIVEALSDSRPAYLEVMPEGERLNRRAEVYISY